MNLDWDNIRCFIEVAEHKSFTRAAEQLKVSVATVARRITALEDQLGLKVFERSPLGVNLTEHGSVIFGLSKPGSEYLYQVERVADSLSKKVQKQPIRISAIETVINEILTPELPALLKQDPDLVVELIVSHENNEPNKNETDIGIALERPKVDSLVTRRIFEPEMGLFCADSYLAGRAPESIDLSSESLLGYTKVYGEILETDWIDGMGLGNNVVFKSNSTDALLRATSMGMGLSLLPLFLGKRRGLIQIPVVPSIPRRELWLVFNSELRSIRHVDSIKKWILDSCHKAFYE